MTQVSKWAIRNMQVKKKVIGKEWFLTLVDGGDDVSVTLAKIVNLRNNPGRVIRQPKHLELALIIQLVDSFQGLLDRGSIVGSVEIKHMDLVCLQRIQRFLKRVLDFGCLETSELKGETFGVDGESLEVEVAHHLFGVAIGVDAGGVEGRVAVGAEGGNDLGCVLVCLDTRSASFRSECHASTILRDWRGYVWVSVG